MKKLTLRILIGLAVVTIILGVILYINLNRIVERTVESQATDSLSLQTELGERGSAEGGPGWPMRGRRRRRRTQPLRSRTAATVETQGTRSGARRSSSRRRIFLAPHWRGR